MTTRGTRRWLAGAAALLAAATMVAGCARTVSGSAQPALPTVSTASSDPQTDTSTDETDTSTDETDSRTDETDSRTDETDSSTDESTSTDETSTDETSTSTSPDETSTSAQTSTGTSSTGTAGTDPDQYPTEPAALPAHPTTETAAVLLESRRLGGYVVDPSAVMPAFSQGTSPTNPLKNAGGLSSLLPSPVPEVADRAGMYAGFVVSRSAEDGPGALIIAALEFPDPAVAKKAATDLANASKSDDGDVKLSVPGLPTAVGWTVKSDANYYSHAFLANGPLVLYAFTEDVAAKKNGLPAILGKAFGAQIVAVAKYTPTPQTKLTELPVDPEGVYARTLPSKEAQLTDGYFTAASMLHLMSGYDSDGKVFATAGVDVVGTSRSTVYRARDAAGAAGIRDAYFAEIHARSPKMTAYPVPDAAGVKCLQDALNATYYCTGAVGRYAFEYRPSSEDDLKKSMASQIALLSK